MGFVSNISGDLGQSTGTLGNMGGTLIGDVMGMGPGGFGSQNYESTQATRANPNLGIGFGMPSGDNPVYGQQSPFQPPTNIGGGQVVNSNLGTPNNFMDSILPTAGLNQNDIPNLFGGFNGGKGGFGGGMLPPGVNIGLPVERNQMPQNGGMIPPGFGGNAQIGVPTVGYPGSAPQPIGSPRQVPAPTNRPVFNQANQPGGVIGGQQQFRGGLRQPPRNYRPPTRMR